MLQSPISIYLPLKYLLHFLSLFTPILLHLKNLLRYFAVFYDTFSLKKMSVNLDFQRTFQYFQALYSVVRFSSQIISTVILIFINIMTVFFDIFCVLDKIAGENGEEEIQAERAERFYTLYFRKILL